MVHHTAIPVWLLTILSVFASTEGFLWLGGRKVSERSQQMPLSPQYLYRGEASPWAAQYTYDGSVPQMTVAVPLALPLPAQTSDDVVTIENPLLNPACDDIAKSPLSLQWPIATREHSIKTSFPMGPMGGGVKGIASPVQLVPCLCPISRDEAQQQQQQGQQTAGYVVQQQPTTTT